jgi:hypothetical protein
MWEMSGHEQKPRVSDEEQQNNRFSFIVGIIIAMAIIVAFALLFNH